ncbi:MAG: response regulator [Verrucomicrobiota bacterium]
MSQSPDNAETQGGTKLKVLVVDDEPTLRLGFAYALSNRTTSVETAATGSIALERIAQVNFDVMILDLRMPEMDGLGVINELRDRGNNIHIVLCSAALSANAALRAIRQGVVDFLPKPVRPVELRKVIEFVLRPERQSLPLALQAARNRQPGEAIRILIAEPSPSPQAASWLNVLTAIQAANGNDAELEEKVLHHLPRLSFSADAVP